MRRLLLGRKAGTVADRQPNPRRAGLTGLRRCTAAFGAAAAAAAATAAVGWTRAVVTGTSMAPALTPGDRLLVRRTRRVRAGDVVVVRDPRAPERELIKRVAAVSAEGLYVLGDDPVRSTDSRTFGAVPRRLLVGRVRYRYAPADRAGRLP